MNNLIEWSQDEQSERTSLASNFMKLRGYYLKSGIFLVVLYGIAFGVFLFEQEHKVLFIPLILTFLAVIFFSQLFVIVGKDRGKIFFYDSECIGYKTGFTQYKLNWGDILSIEIAKTLNENNETITFKAKSTNLVTRPDLTISVEKNSEIYKELMEKVVSVKLPVKSV
jgi:hypothetical protein